MSARFAVIGDPVHKSLSPALFGWLFAREGYDGVYEALHVKPEALGAVVEDMRLGAWRGVSVTAPHKVAVRALIDAEDASAAKIGAVNTLSCSDGVVTGHNTDAEGCRRALAEVGCDLAGARVLVLGAGGAARAGVHAALGAGALAVSIANRTFAHAEALASADPKCAAVPPTASAVQSALEHADILIQSSTVGMGAPETSPLPAGVALHRGLCVLDMVYRPLETALLRQARERGCRTADGLWMLTHQALEQFRLWTGRQADAEAARGLHQFLSEKAT